MSTHQGQVRSSSRLATTSAISGVSAFVAVIFVWELAGTTIGGVLFVAVVPLTAVALILAAAEFILMRRQVLQRPAHANPYWRHLCVFVDSGFLFLAYMGHGRITNRWTRAAGACFATCLVRQGCFDSRRRVNSTVMLLSYSVRLKTLGYVSPIYNHADRRGFT